MLPDRACPSLYSRAGLGEPGRPDWLNPAASGELGTLGLLAWSPSSAQSRATRPPGRVRQAICDDLRWVLASIFDVFSWFFDMPWRERLDSLRTGPNLRFCWQAQYFRGFAGSANKTQNRETSIEHCLDDAPQASRVPEAHRFPFRARLSLDLRRLGALPDAPRRSL